MHARYSPNLIALLVCMTSLSSCCAQAETPPTAQQRQFVDPDANKPAVATAAPTKASQDDASATDDFQQQVISIPNVLTAMQNLEPATQAATQPGASAPAAPAMPTKQEILNSPQWRRAMFEFNEWLSAQPIYTPEQVRQVKDSFNRKVAAMDASEVASLLADMEEKIQIMSTPAARDARAWMAQYLSVISDRKRDDLLRDVPNIATMTAAQLSAELAKINEKRQDLNSQQTAFQRGQAAQVANQIQNDRTSSQNFVRNWNTAPTTLSPYRSSNDVNQRLNEANIGSGMGFFVGPFGGVGMSFGPSSW